LIAVVRVPLFEYYHLVAVNQLPVYECFVRLPLF